MAVTLRVCWAALLLAAGAWQLSSCWSGSPATLVGVPVAALVLLVVLSRLLPAAAACLVVLLQGAVVFYVGCVRNGLVPGSVLRQGIAGLLAAPRPAPATLELLLPGVVVVFLIGVWVGLRLARGRGLIAAPVAGVALYIAAALLTAGQADPRGAVAAAIVVVATLGWTSVASSAPARAALSSPGGVSAVAAAGSGRAALPSPRAAAGIAGRRTIPVLVLATGIALLLAPIASSGAFDPARLVEPQGRQVNEPSPLPRMAAWHQLGDAELLRFVDEVDRPLRLVALNDYTGASWSAQAQYRRLGSIADPRIRSADIAVTIAALEGRWLPNPGRPLAISLSDVEVDSDSGSLALRDDSLRPGLSYRVTTDVDRLTEEQVALAGASPDANVRRYLQLPAAPASFGDYARTITDGATTPFEKAVSIEYAVRQGRRHVLVAPSGSSYARLETFLFRPDGSEAGAQEGTSEQFASAFAVLARAVGIPTRIVVGFAPDGPRVGDARIVRGRDARAWPEVYFEGLGWYPFDPTPLTTQSTVSSERKQAVINRLFQQVVRSPAASPAPTVSRPKPAFPVAAPKAPLWTPVYSVAIAAVMVLILLMLLAARGVRSWRHRRAGARGAWAEMLDVLLLMGRSQPRSRPAPEIAADFAMIARAPGAVHPAMTVAKATDRVAFGPAGRGADPDGIWQAMKTVRRAARSTIPWYRRLTWAFDPRPLWRARRR